MWVIPENYDHHHSSILDQTIWIYVDSDSMMIYYDRFYDRPMMIYVDCFLSHFSAKIYPKETSRCDTLTLKTRSFATSTTAAG